MQLSTKARIAMGQSALLLSLLLTAIFFGLVPDRDAAVREGRAALAEALAANSSLLVSKDDVRRLGADLNLVVERNPALESAAVRMASGRALVTVGEHKEYWRELDGEYSTDTQLQVPIMAGTSEWGQIELRFRAARRSGALGILTNPWVQLVAFITLASFITFYFYLGKMLKQLDPSQAIPSRVRAALDTMAEGLLVVDARQNVVLANQAFAELVNEAPDDLIGRPVKDFPWIDRNGEALPASDYPWAKAIADGTQQKKVTIGLDAPSGADDGQRRTFTVNCSPILAGERKVGGVLVSLDDITQLKRTEVQLRQSRDEAEAANRAKSEFIANVSHEIRTPMNAILGFTEVLKRGYGNSAGDYQKHLTTIASSGKHLLELINDILDLSKAESGRLVVETEALPAHRVIMDVVSVLQVKAGEKGITLTFEAEGPLPETVLTDAAMLRQIVTNLVGNAVKFTEQGGVHLVARLRSDGPAPLLEVDIIDTGIGMAADKVEAVFDPFVQADSSVTRRFGGTGLGLAICRKYARALGGDAVATSESGVGSTFTATIATGPLDGIRMLTPEEVMADAKDSAADDTSCWEFPSARILVVDDGAENRELLELVLAEMNLEVVTAENGKQGSDLAIDGGFDLVLMDVQMPVMDGFTAARRIRDAGLALPVVALTANAMKGFEAQCEAAGYSHYLTKPVEFERLFALLADLLGGRRVDEAAPAARAQPAPAPVIQNPPPSADSIAEQPRAEMLESVFDESPIVSRLIDRPRLWPAIGRFVERLDEQLDAMESAREKDDYEELAALAHWLKGAGGTVGFDAFTEPARQLEDAAKAADHAACGSAIKALRCLANRIEKPEPADSAVEASAS